MWPGRYFFGAGKSIQLFAQVFVGVADSVEAFGFKFGMRHVFPPMPDSGGDGFGKEADLFDHLDDGQADKFKVFHAGGPGFSFRQSAQRGRKSGWAMISALTDPAG